MKKIILVCFILSSYAAFSQSLSVFDVNTDDFPIVRAKFWAFDENGEQILNLDPTDFEVKENGVLRDVLSVSCPTQKPPEAISSVLVMDASGSMGSGNLDLAKSAARVWIEGMALKKSECAITAFNEANFIIQDFTRDRNLLKEKVNSLFASGGTDYDAAMLNPMAGGLLVAKNGKYKRVIVFLTDGQPNENPQTSKIIAEANAYDIAIYSVTLNMQCPESMKDISLQTGGQWFENISSEEEAQQIYQQILYIAQGTDPCEIEWESGVACYAGITNVDLRIMNLGVNSETSYQMPNTSVSKLKFEPSYIKFTDPQVGVRVEEKVEVTAINADFTITNITSNNAAFEITPKSFYLNEGQSIELTVSYIPPDSGYVYSKFDFESEPCITKYYASGGWKGKLPTIRTIKLLHPNGGEVFVAGSDTVITWEGIPPEEPVMLEYRTDDDQPWITISDSATGLSHPFRVPSIASNKYLARVTAKTTYQGCDNPDVELCGKIWMGCNLDVEYYRNGDSIPHVTDPDEWANLTTGAWCYYDNDPANGEIYGKLFNFYAVKDPRGLAPEGWHVPSDEEWEELEMCLGMDQDEVRHSDWRGTNEGSKLAGNENLWKNGDLRSNPEFGSSGFNALPCGYRTTEGKFTMKNFGAYFWTSSGNWQSTAMLRYLNFQQSGIRRLYDHRSEGYSVRCVRD
jgi:VWFA-related protein